ncbi:MAG TPA: lipoprotein-releasing ABC transporter permease subunit [Rhodanobacteraceae bacterium]|nr:lipoprotein-releasing ABC transporter permease subunit [Rhodanobacteraceae bacterium]
MFRPLSIFIGLRYTRAKRRNHFISFISLVSMLGIIIGIMALITVISVMNGFDYQMRTRILGAVAHATISGVGESVQDWQHALKVAEANPHVKGAAPYVRSPVFLQGRASTGALIRGVIPEDEARVADFDTHMKAGSIKALTPGGWGIVLGSDLALQLGVGVGDKVTVYAPSYRATPMGAMPRLRRFAVVGIFSVGMQQFDSGLALINMRDAETLFGADGPTGIRLRLDDVYQAWPVAQSLMSKLGQRYRVQTWIQSNVNLFKALSMEKVVMFIILSLIIAVAAFNLVSSLVMVVTDKQADIAILRTLGATPRTVMGVFVVQGLVIGMVGIALGVLFGVLLAINVPAIVDWIQNLFHVQFLSPDVYYISEVPSQLHWSDVGWIAGMAFIFSLLATLYPAWRASRTQPAQALRYE